MWPAPGAQRGLVPTPKGVGGEGQRGPPPWRAGLGLPRAARRGGGAGAAAMKTVLGEKCDHEVREKQTAMKKTTSRLRGKCYNEGSIK